MLHPKQARYQASLQPEPQEQRLDSSTKTSADVSGFARKSFGEVSEGPRVTKTLPSHHKLAENTRQTCQGPRFDGRAIGSATITLPIRALRMRRRAGRHRDGSGEF